MEGIKESAKKYAELGLSLVLVAEGSKRPIQRDWQSKGVDIDEIKDHHNIGILHNHSGTCSIDIDSREDAIKVFKDYLGLDPIEMKRLYPCYRGKREGIKFIFKMPQIENLSIKKLVYKENDSVTTVFELRGSSGHQGVQDLIPPSKHPSGVHYEWVNPLPSNYEDIPELPQRLQELWVNFDVEERPMLFCLNKLKPEKVKPKLTKNVDSEDLIERFNAAHSVEQILVNNGYEKKGDNRFLSPHSTTNTPGLVLLEDGTIYSHHAGDLLGDGHSHDAFDVFRILQNDSDWSKAFNGAREKLGIEPVIYEKPIDTRPFKFFHASEAIDNATPPKWIIKNVLEEDSLVGIFGNAKSGKSFVAIDMACCVSTGLDWHEKHTKEGLVLYLCAEGHRGISRRFLAWEAVNNKKLNKAKLHYSERGVQVLDDLDIEMMRNEALVIQDNYKEAPKMVVIDTVARSFGPGSENSTEDMNRFIANVDRFIREEFKCCTVLIHHTGHGENTKSRGRGSSVLPAALDAEMKVTKKEESYTKWNVDLEQTLIKDGKGIAPMRFAFQETEFHHLSDEQGDPTTSGALVQIDYVKEDKTKQISTKQQEVLDALEGIWLRKANNARNNNEDVETIIVTQKEWRDELGYDFTHPKKALIEKGEVEEIEPLKYKPSNRSLF